MKNTVISVLATGVLFSSCANKSLDQSTDNPLLNTFETPHGVPPFDKIKEEHYSPAIIKSIGLAKDEIQAIINNTEAPTFENTIVALANAGEQLGTVSAVFFNMLSANTNDKLQSIAQEVSPALSQYQDDIYLNEQLFDKVKAVYEQKANLNLNTEQTTLLEKTYKDFVRSGANLTTEDKARLRKINETLSLSNLKFNDNVLKDINSYVLYIDDTNKLKGLPASVIEAAHETAKEKGEDQKWAFTLSNASVMNFLQYANNRELRKEIWNAYQNIGNNNNANDNKQVIKDLVTLRSEKARLLGYPSFAAYSLEETMAKTPENVEKLIGQLWQPALQKAKAESADIAAKMKADGITDGVKPYDWRYYTEKIRVERYNLDEQELKPYFSLDNVRKGVFEVTEKLFGLQFNQLSNLPVYHKDVETWEVKDKDGSLLGILYMDFFPRASKSSGAWMTSYREQETVNGKRIIPVISIVCNFTPPTKTTPSLLTFDETTTFFHEFGHALHGLLSNVQYRTLAGTSVSRDFVELPSQVMENWAAEPEVMKLYAKHYQTGEVIPDALIQKIINAGTFDQGFQTVEYLAASLLDLNYHKTNDPITDVNAFEAESMKKIGLTSDIIPRYRSTYFKHIFGGGYAAGYYSYIWSGVLDTDAFEAFKSTSLFNPEKANAFRKNILEKGGTEDPEVLYKAFRGQSPSIQPLLKKRGLDNTTSVQAKLN